jgi:hypothetical protein
LIYFYQLAIIRKSIKKIMINQLDLQPLFWLYGLFPSQAVITAANTKSPLIPKDSNTGKLLLEAVKKEQTERQAARTALALVRCGASSEVISLDQETSVPDPLPEEEVLWKRHEFNSGNLVIFARGESEAITIRKSPEGPGWFIDFGGPHYIRPK